MPELENEIIAMVATFCRGANPNKLLDTPVTITVDVNKSGERGVSCPYSSTLLMPNNNEAQIQTRDNVRDLKRLIICLGEGPGIISLPSFSREAYSDLSSFLEEVRRKCHPCIQKYPD